MGTHTVLSAERAPSPKLKVVTLNPTTAKVIADIPTHEKYITTDAYRGTIEYIINNDSDTQNIYRRRQEFASRELASIKQFGAIRLHIAIPGNTKVHAGDTIDIIIPSAEDTTDGRRENDRFLNGKYLITAISHKFDANTGEYICVIECMRNSYENQV